MLVLQEEVCLWPAGGHLQADALCSTRKLLPEPYVYISLDSVHKVSFCLSMDAEMPYRKYTSCNIPNILRSLRHQVNNGARLLKSQWTYDECDISLRLQSILQHRNANRSDQAIKVLQKEAGVEYPTTTACKRSHPPRITSSTYVQISPFSPSSLR
jgi:hypothetical protein